MSKTFNHDFFDEEHYKNEKIKVIQFLEHESLILMLASLDHYYIVQPPDLYGNISFLCKDCDLTGYLSGDTGRMIGSIFRIICYVDYAITLKF